MRQQFSIPKPFDIFAADMLRYVAEKYNAPQCADLRVKLRQSTKIPQNTVRVGMRKLTFALRFWKIA